MRVLHWYPNFLGGGGVANAVLGLINSQARQGLTLALAAMDRPGTPLYGPIRNQLADGIELIEWRPTWTLRRGNLTWHGLPGAAGRKMQAWQPDLVHVHGEFNPDNLRVPRLLPGPLVLSNHGAFHPIVLEKSRAWQKRVYVAIARRRLYRRAVLHALTPMDAEYSARLVPGATVYLAPNGPSHQVAPFLGPATEAVARADDRVRLLYVGRLDVQTKGLDLLLGAVAEVSRQLPSRRLHLTLVGPDWQGGRRVLEQLAVTLGITDRVEWAGTKLGPDLAEAYRACDLYVQCSRHEGQSITSTEALLTGKPALLSENIALVSFPEVRDSDGVVLVAPTPATVAAGLLRAVTELENLEQGAAHAWPAIHERFSWDRIVAAHLQAYEELRASRRA